MKTSFELPQLYNPETPAKRGERKEREILGTVNQEAKQEVAEVMELVRKREGNIEESLVEKITVIFGEMTTSQRAAVVDALFADLQTYTDRQAQRAVMIDWVMRRKLPCGRDRRAFPRPTCLQVDKF